MNPKNFGQPTPTDAFIKSQKPVVALYTANTAEDAFYGNLKKQQWADPAFRQAKVDAIYAKNALYADLEARYFPPAKNGPQYGPWNQIKVPYNPDPGFGHGSKYNAANMIVEGQVLSKKEVPRSVWNRLTPQAKRSAVAMLRAGRKLNPLLNILDILADMWEWRDAFAFVGNHVSPDYRWIGNGFARCASTALCNVPPTHQVNYAAPGCISYSQFGPCLPGQSVSAGAIAPIPAGVGKINFFSNVGQQVGRFTLVAEWTRTSGNSNTWPAGDQPVFVGFKAGFMPSTVNANVARRVNLTPQPYDPPRAPLRPLPADFVAPRTLVATINPPPGFRPPIAVKAHRSLPPRAREKQTKGQAGKLAAAFAKALDKISEGTEVIDAIYQALPKDVQDKWGCDDLNRPGDQYGQYGITQVDCKAKALWHNWHKVDVRVAIFMIAANAITDKFHGALHGARDKVRPGNMRPLKNKYGITVGWTSA